MVLDSTDEASLDFSTLFGEDDFSLGVSGDGFGIGDTTGDLDGRLSFAGSAPLEP